MDWNEQHAVFVFVAIVFVVYIPLSLYYGFKYYQNRNHIIYQKRYSSIMIFEIIVIISKLMLDSARDIAGLYSAQSELFYVSHIFVSLVASLCYDIMVCIWLWRFYCLHFDLCWTNLMLNQNWRCIINAPDTFKHNKKSFYVKYKSSFGNSKWMFYHIILPLIIFLFASTNLLQFILSYFYNLDSTIINEIKLYCSPIAIAPSIVLSIIFCCIPSFEDNFFIKNELKLLLVVILIMYISYWSYYFFIEFGDNLVIDLHVNVGIISKQLELFCDFLCLMISTGLVNKKMQNIITLKTYQIHQVKINCSDNTKDIDVPLIQIKPECDPIGDNIDKMLKQLNVNIYDALENDKGIEIFMQHLQHEISTENFLGFIELLQFQKYIIDDRKLLINNGQILMYNKVVLALNVPKSLIVYNERMDFKNKAKDLYAKYIESGAKYQINIEQRTVKTYAKYMEILHNINEYDLFEFVNILDEILYQLHDLLVQSFNRFETSSECRKFSSLISK